MNRVVHLLLITCLSCSVAIAQTYKGKFVEANYDEIMLQNDIKRPWQTKQRISSRHGHLSNDQTAELVASVASEKLRHVVLGHLSDDCNTPEVACRALSGFRGVDRRSQVIGEAGGVLVMDDYAHHPAEIIATLANCSRAASPTTARLSLGGNTMQARMIWNRYMNRGEIRPPPRL